MSATETLLAMSASDVIGTTIRYRPSKTSRYRYGIIRSFSAANVKVMTHDGRLEVVPFTGIFGIKEP